MRKIEVENYVYPRTEFVECVLSGECPGRPEMLPRAEIIDVDKHLIDIGITAAFRTSFGTVYVYENKLPFYFVDGVGPSEESVSVIQSFIDEGFTRVRGAAAPLHLQYVFIDFKPLYYVEIKNNDYTLIGAVKHGKEYRVYSYKRVVDQYSGNVTSQEIRFYPPDGDVEIKVLGEFVDSWDEFLGEVRRMRKYSNKSIIMKTFDLPGVVNTSRYPVNSGYDDLMDVLRASKEIAYDNMGPVLSSGSFVGKFVFQMNKVISFYPFRTSFDGFDVPAEFILGGVKENQIALVLFM